MKLCVYTCITGNYDSLKPIRNQNPDIDFICFTDNPMLRFNDQNWIIRPIPDDLLNLSKVKQQRLVKILPHKYLKDYDISLWVDGNIEILTDVKKFIEGYDLGEIHFYTRRHPSRKCVFEEAKAVMRIKRDNAKNILPQIEKYKKEGMPVNFGLEETGVILRRHNETYCQILCNMWAKELVSQSHRDQISFDYCRWKTGVDIGFLKLPRLTSNFGFKLSRHGK